MTTLDDKRITESSTLAASIKHPGLALTLDDDGDLIFYIDPETGHTVSTFAIKGTVDKEALDVSKNGVITIWDGGNNDLKRKTQYIHVLPEPEVLRPNLGFLKTSKYAVKYPKGGKFNSEVLIVHPFTSQKFVATKAKDGHLYEVPAKLRKIGTNTLIDRGPIPVPWASDASFLRNGRGSVWRQKGVPASVKVLDDQWQDFGDIPVSATKKPESITTLLDGSRFAYGSEGKNSPLVIKSLPVRYV